MADLDKKILNDAELGKVSAGTASGPVSYVCPLCSGPVSSGHAKIEGMIYHYWECVRCGHRVLVDKPDCTDGLRQIILKAPGGTSA